MEAITQNTIKLTDNLEINQTIFEEFNEIISCIVDSTSEVGLRALLPIMPLHFKIGFGGSHMWVKQIIGGEPKQQVIFVNLYY